MSLDATLFTLVRHGHTAANSPAGMRLSGWTDTPLSDRGRVEAALAARALARRPAPAALYASPLQRARDTAAAIGAALGLEPRLVPELREIHCGEVDGRSVEHVRAHHAAEWARNGEEADERFRWPGGESYRELRARCLRAVRALAARHPGERVVVVTHAGFVTQVLGSIAGVSCARWSAFRPRNGSFSTVAWGPRGRALVTFDEHAHLAPAHARPTSRPLAG
jgi:probable phosphoglycerate mutase